ncbi:hypothetical protein [Zhongshania sp.]|uniref:hypothetical protein n=1 Tax=Zhongshania sp. TaxID=1971902 RepID=UPI0039E22852
MDEVIEVSLERVEKIIDGFGADDFSTVAVLREYCGGFFSNKETPAYYSFNAQFGKLLRRNEERLGIVQVESAASETDDRVPPVKTTTSIWRRNA